MNSNLKEDTTNIIVKSADSNIYNNTVANKRVKKIGSREEVYNGNALQTSGGMTRDDIMQEMRGGNIYYKSKIISQRMKENSPLLKNKKLTRKKVAFNEENNTIKNYEI